MGGGKCHHLENLKAANGLDSYAFLYHHFVKSNTLLGSATSAPPLHDGKCSPNQPHPASNTHLGGEALDLTELSSSETQTMDECNRAKVTKMALLIMQSDNFFWNLKRWCTLHCCIILFKCQA